MLPCAPRIICHQPPWRNGSDVLASVNRQVMRELIEEENSPEMRELRRREYEVHQRICAGIDRWLEQREAERIARAQWREFLTWPNWVSTVAIVAGFLGAILFLVSPYNPLP